MFDIGFWELAIIAVVGLLVIGPERLPGVARTAGMWIGRTRRFITTVKT
ncbi:MAG: Sec-independent protein translocase protein TatB, partial [Gammaproteobacteria bacterium]|nr:Sec-independent protein translocase protein TatB [Gammaproteobacteria bacterium]